MHAVSVYLTVRLLAPSNYVLSLVGLPADGRSAVIAEVTGNELTASP